MLIHQAVCCTVFVCGSIALAQPIKSWSSYADYCHDSPHAMTCHDGKPIDMSEALKQYEYHPKPEESTEQAPATARPVRTSPRLTTVSPRPRARVGASPSMIQVGELDWRFAHPHPDLLIGMDLESLLRSDLMRTLLRDWAGKLGATPKEQDQMLAGLGDSKRLLISIFNKDVLAMMVGNIGNLPEGGLPGGLRFTRLSTDTVLMGSDGGSFGAMTRLKLPPSPNAQQEEPKLMARTHDFWIWGRPDRLAGPGPGTAGTSPITKMKMGLTLRDGFNFQMILDTPDAASAARLLEGMQRTSPRGMKGAVEGNSVRYAMVLDRDAALQRFAGFMTDSVGKQFAPLIAAARQMSARQPATPRPAGKIIIDGLDDGPKEVPVPQRQ
jgi:hypothetical protein